MRKLFAYLAPCRKLCALNEKDLRRSEHMLATEFPLIEFKPDRDCTAAKRTRFTLEKEVETHRATAVSAPVWHHVCRVAVVAQFPD